MLLSRAYDLREGKAVSLMIYRSERQQPAVEGLVILYGSALASNIRLQCEQLVVVSVTQLFDDRKRKTQQRERERVVGGNYSINCVL